MKITQKGFLNDLDVGLINGEQAQSFKVKHKSSCTC